MSGELESREFFVEVPGGTVYTKLWAPHGAGEATPVVLFHDSLGCAEMWREFPQTLAIRLRRPVIAYDRLGFGRSSGRQELPSVRFVSEEAELYFPAVRRHLGIRQFVALGHSIGGAMAVIIAARFPDDCQAVITEAAQAFVEPLTVDSIAEAKAKFAAPDALVKLRQYHGDRARWVVDAWTETWLSPQFRDWNLEAALAQVMCPLLAIHGDKDEYGSVAFPEALCRLTAGPAEKLILEGCGHVPHREHELRVLDAMELFLGRAIEARKVSHR